MSDDNRFPIMVDDCDLFEQDLFPNEFEYFCKHVQAFKSMWLEKTTNSKIDFIEEFFYYAENYGYIRDFPLKMTSKKKYFDAAKEFLIENFAKAKVSAAKSIIQQIAVIASNKEKILQLGGVAKAKDPFYIKETRDTFRTFFGEPAQQDTWKKTVANMPLYTRFSGAVCRVLRRWVEGFSVPPEFARKSSCLKRDSEESKGGEKKSSSSIHKVSLESNAVSEGTIVFESSSIDTGKSDEGVKKLKTELLNKELGAVGLAVVDSSGKETEGARKDEKSGHLNGSRARLHHCSWCQVVEPEARYYKKCAWCKGKGTRFYCSKDCQTEDWVSRHKQHHVNRGVH